ncbi:hypothetical protein D9615_008917 [Tricholomella constricta]|uniref:Major facilitator superfamily (MFS) profile domain-containing protein n=1 Tax=Tricholomella constricta TaxID=117010 RepID=A0A8H5H112_9AGAR|nr:hypothetical protein D9615_008917 [Tricholomella constricta]
MASESPTCAESPDTISNAVAEAADPRRRAREMVLTDQTNLLPFKQVIAVFSGLALCIVVSTLDSVIVATALPTISTAFNAGSVVSWVPSAYLLSSTSFQPLYGRFSDIFGRKAALCLAMSVFMVGNLVAGFSKNIIQLIVFRGFAGAGGGGIISMAQIVISDIVSLRERGKYQGIIGGAVALGYAIGPVIGGALSQKVSWRWCFWIDIPISFSAMCVVVFVLPLKPVEGDMKSKLLVVDYLGAGLALLGCSLGGVTFPWKSAVVLAPLLSGFVVMVLFCLWEWKGAQLPIVPMYIFKHVTVTGVYITMFINGFVFFSSLYYLPQFFQIGLGYTPIRAGIFLIPLLVSQMLSSWVSGVVTIIHFGFAVWAIACGCISTITPHSSKAALVIFMLLGGAGAGMTLQTTTVAAQASVPRKDMSVVTAFRNVSGIIRDCRPFHDNVLWDSSAPFNVLTSPRRLFRNNSLTNSMKSISLPPSIISKIVDDPSSLGSPLDIGIPASTAMYILNNGFTKGFKSVFILNAVLAAVATVASILMIRHKELTRGDEETLRMSAEREEKRGGSMNPPPRDDSELRV